MNNGAVTNVIPTSCAVNSATSTLEQNLAFWRSLLAWDSLFFAVICILDMISTLCWVNDGKATESNPWLAYWLGQSMACFVFVKLMSFLPTLAVSAYYRESYPKFVSTCLRCALAAYLIIYFGSIAKQFVAG